METGCEAPKLRVTDVTEQKFELLIGAADRPRVQTRGVVAGRASVWDMASDGGHLAMNLWD